MLYGKEPLGERLKKEQIENALNSKSLRREKITAPKWSWRESSHTEAGGDPAFL